MVIPFKGSPAAKSRLSVAQDHFPPVDHALRNRLARAFLLDTLTATLATNCIGQIILVSSDPLIPRSVPEAIIIDDPGVGLNGAITAGVAHAKALRPNALIAVLTGDLPGLISDDLQTALMLAEQHQLSVVADHAGTGTTMITGMPGTEILPQFGPESHRKHIGLGHHSLQVPVDSTLRQDVDTPRDLDRALRWGVGAATRHAITPSRRKTPKLPHQIAFPLERTP